jgi:hypothetical protein
MMLELDDGERVEPKEHDAGTRSWQVAEEEHDAATR